METFVYIFLVVMALGLIKVVFDYLKSILVWLSNLLGVERDAEKEKTNKGIFIGLNKEGYAKIKIDEKIQTYSSIHLI